MFGTSGLHMQNTFWNNSESLVMAAYCETPPKHWLNNATLILLSRGWRSTNRFTPTQSRHSHGPMPQTPLFAAPLLPWFAEVIGKYVVPSVGQVLVLNHEVDLGIVEVAPRFAEMPRIPGAAHGQCVVENDQLVTFASLRGDVPGFERRAIF